MHNRETLQFQGNKRMGDAEKNMQVCPSPPEETFQYIKRTFLYAKVANPQICRKMVRNLIWIPCHLTMVLMTLKSAVCVRAGTPANQSGHTGDLHLNLLLCTRSTHPEFRACTRLVIVLRPQWGLLSYLLLTSSHVGTVTPRSNLATAMETKISLLHP